MFDKLDAFCQNTQAMVRIWRQNVPAARGKAEPRYVRCENSAGCPRNAFCRFVNPLTTNIPLSFNPPPAAGPAAHKKSAAASTRMPPVMDRPASS